MQDGRDGDENPGYIGNISNGVTIGFKSFDMHGVTCVGIATRGYAKGVFEVRTAWDGEAIAEIPVNYSNVWEHGEAPFSIPDGVYALYLTFRGFGNCSLQYISLK